MLQNEFLCSHLLSDLNVKKKSLFRPKFNFSYALALLHITTGGAQQPAPLTQQTVAVVLASLFALQINQICDVPFIYLS